MKRVIVIGESCRDIFVYCSANRLAPDLPVPVLQVESETSNPGMAANVCRNIQAIGLDAELFTNLDWQSISKTRYMHSQTNHMFLRVDTPHNIEAAPHLPSLKDFEAVVISDYNKGFLSEELISKICSSHPLVFLDTKKPLNSWAEQATYIKINDFEFNRSLKTMSQQLRENVIHTIGMGGAIYKGVTYPVRPVEVVDSSGAGDAFMASLVCNFLKTKDIEQSISAANEAASKVVAKRGVSLIES